MEEEVVGFACLVLLGRHRLGLPGRARVTRGTGPPKPASLFFPIYTPFSFKADSSFNRTWQKNFLFRLLFHFFLRNFNANREVDSKYWWHLRACFYLFRIFYFYFSGGEIALKKSSHTYFRWLVKWEREFFLPAEGEYIIILLNEKESSQLLYPKAWAF